MIANYTSKWRAYEEKWKNQPLANEVENIKKQAFDIDIECKYIIHVAFMLFKSLNPLGVKKVSCNIL